MASAVMIDFDSLLNHSMMTCRLHSLHPRVVDVLRHYLSKVPMLVMLYWYLDLDFSVVTISESFACPAWIFTDEVRPCTKDLIVIKLPTNTFYATWAFNYS